MTRSLKTMSPIEVVNPSRARRWKRLLVLLALGCAALTTESGTQAASPDALPYSLGYLVTGDYVVGGVNLNGATSSNGFVTGTIPMNGVPTNADIVAAFLYWETLYSNTSQLKGAKFRGQAIDAMKMSKAPLGLPVAPCFSSGANFITMMRADVLTLLPEQKDVNGNPTGKRLVNDTDLKDYGYALHTVRLPDVGSGNLAPQSAGASLVVVYRDPNPNAPLKKIVFYDGVYVQAQGAVMNQTIRGFLQTSTANRAAKMTHLVGSGSPNKSARLTFNGSAVSTDPYNEITNAYSHRNWSNPTFNNLGSLMTGLDAGLGYGEEATVKVDHVKTTPYDCLSLAAIVFSTTVQDIDGDGLIDYLEDHSGVKDASGKLLPDIHGMGASSAHKDLFVEVNSMWAGPGTTYGSASAPYDSEKHIDSVTDFTGHTHIPPPAVFKMVGDLLWCQGLDGCTPGVTDNPNRIVAHFDVGPLNVYHNGDPAHLKVPYSSDADQYLVPTPYARGGELIEEKKCIATPTLPCEFPDYPGTVGWKVGYELKMLAPVANNGSELSSLDDTACSAKNPPAICSDHRTRFDLNRNGVFHSLLYAHLRGKPKSPFPCLDGQNKPVGPNMMGTCDVKPNPEFRVPSGSSGVSDLPGSKSMVSLGRFSAGDFVGSDFVVGSTTAHEVFHSTNLWHGGAEPTYIKTGIAPNVRVNVSFEPNCKPNYISVMSYMFQVTGALDDVHPGPQLVLSGDVNADINEPPPLSDGLFGPNYQPMRYHAAWFQRMVAPNTPGFLEPLGSLAYTSTPPTTIQDPQFPNDPTKTINVRLGAKRHCDGSPLTPDEVAARLAERGMIRMTAPSSASSLDWNGDGSIDSSTSIDLVFPPYPDGILNAGPLDLNFDGSKVGSFRGFNDWRNVRLNQVGLGAEDLTADESGGTILDASGGTILDASGGTILDASGGFILDASGGFILDASGGLILDASGGTILDASGGTILDASGGFILDASGGFILDASGGTILDASGGLILDASGGLILDASGGTILDASGGQDGLNELTDKDADDIVGPTPPTHVTACVIGHAGCPDPRVPVGLPHRHRVDFEKPNKDANLVTQYDVYRITGDIVAPSSKVLKVGSTTPPTMTFVDEEELPDGQKFMYYVLAIRGSAPSPPSNYATVTADNTAPTANNFSDTANEDTPLLGNVLAHVADGDSAPGALRAFLVSGPSAGTLVLNPNGSYTFTPPADFESLDPLNGGTVTFKYKANDGTWRNGTPPPAGTGTIEQLPYSNDATVTITVISRHTVASLASSAPPGGSTYGDPVTFTATVSPISPALGTPTGNVTFTVDGTTFVVPIAGGQAMYTTSSLTAGSHSITAVYCGVTTTFCAPDTVFYGSSPATLSPTVNPRPLTPSVTAQNKTYNGNDAATMTSCSLANVVAADSAFVSCAALGPNTFDSANAGNGRTVTATTINLGGSAAGNYQLTSTTATTHADIYKANATIAVTPYNVGFDGVAHTATGTATGVLTEALSELLNLSGTTHTEVGDYANDPWSFAGNVNYNSAGGTVHDHVGPVNLGVANTGNCYPFMCNDSGTSEGQSIHYQQIYASSAFSATTPIKSLTFFDIFSTQFGGTTAVLSGNYRVSLSTTTRAVGGLSPDLASNIGADSTVIFNGSLAGVTTTPSFTITGTTPFVYDPTQGNLLLDIVVTNQTVLANGSGNGYNDADSTGTSTTRAYAILGNSTSSGPLALIGLVTQFNKTPPITYTFTGTVSQVDPSLSGTFNTSMALSGSFTYESATPGSLCVECTESQGYSDYPHALTNLVMHVGTYTASPPFGTDVFSGMQVVNNWFESSGFNVTSRLSGTQFNGYNPLGGLFFYTTDSGVFSNTKLTDVGNLTGWTSQHSGAFWYLAFDCCGGQPGISGVITSITRLP